MGNIDTAMNDFVLPKMITYDRDYYCELKVELDRYIEYVRGIKNLSENCISNVVINSNKLLQCIEEYYNANVWEAQEYIVDILNKYVDSPHIVAPISENYAFKGSSPEKLRPSIYKNSEEYIEIYNSMLKSEPSFFRARLNAENLDIKGMFHIPFNARGLIATQRFSMPGVPCLYLATTTYGAWIEMSRPEAEVFHVSSLKIPDDLRVLNLCISQMFINGAASFANREEIKELEKYIEIYPLILATSFRVIEMNRKFKSEYIIAQLVMQSSRKLGIDGVAYLSKRTSDFYAFPHAVNLAILIPQNFKEIRSYWSRSWEVELTKPKRFSEFLVENSIAHGNHKAPFNSYVNEHFRHSGTNSIEDLGKSVDYISTKFSEFDEFLVNEEFISFRES